MSIFAAAKWHNIVQTVCVLIAKNINYELCNLLKGKRGIIFGALNEMSIAWKVAEKAVEEGATITLSITPGSA